MSFRRVILFVCTLQLSAAAQPRRIFDRIVAVVDHDPILLSELHTAVRPFFHVIDQQTDEKQREEMRAKALREVLDRACA